MLKKKTMTATALSVMLLSSTAFAGLFSSPDVVEVEVEPDYTCNALETRCTPFWSYTIFSLVDGLIVKGAVVNNGKCAIKSRNFGRLLQEDDYAELTVRTDEKLRSCRPKSIDIRTNKGDYSFTFDD